MRVIKESDEEFKELHAITQGKSEAFPYSALADEIKMQAQNHNQSKILIRFPHTYLSNLVYGLKRRGLIRGEHYTLHRLNKCYKIPPSSQAKTTQILIQPLAYKKK